MGWNGNVGLGTASTFPFFFKVVWRPRVSTTSRESTVFEVSHTFRCRCRCFIDIVDLLDELMGLVEGLMTPLQAGQTRLPALIDAHLFGVDGRLFVKKKQKKTKLVAENCNWRARVGSTSSGRPRRQRISISELLVVANSQKKYSKESTYRRRRSDPIKTQ